MASLAWLDTQVGVWTAVTFAVIGAMNMPLTVIQGGMTRRLALPHFVSFALIAYLAAQPFGTHPLPAGSSVRTYALTVLVVNGISLAFDVQNTVRWIRGDREVLERAFADVNKPSN